MGPLLVYIDVGLDERNPVEESGRVEAVLLGTAGTQVFEGSELFCPGPADDIFNDEAKT